ncbi:MAG: flagellar biosynthesis protein FliQ [Deltaproteobacteria bacterium]|nr:flagellar biosynthesis protein FliQ [Deltaproteobacteria bacterium]
MSADQVIALVREMLWLALVVAAPILGVGLVVGLAIAVLQAATQIQESSLSFLPKLVAMGAALAISGPWALERLVAFTHRLLSALASLPAAPHGAF